MSSFGARKWIKKHTYDRHPRRRRHAAAADCEGSARRSRRRRFFRRQSAAWPWSTDISDRMHWFRATIMTCIQLNSSHGCNSVNYFTCHLHVNMGLIATRINTLAKHDEKLYARTICLVNHLMAWIMHVLQLFVMSMQSEYNHSPPKNMV